MTLERTTLGYKNVGQAVNLEVNVLAKYVEQLLECRRGARWREGSTPSSRAIEDIRAGRAIVVVDDEDQESEGDLIFATSQSDTAAAGLPIKHTGGVRVDAMEAASSIGSSCRP